MIFEKNWKISEKSIFLYFCERKSINRLKSPFAMNIFFWFYRPRVRGKVDDFESSLQDKPGSGKETSVRRGAFRCQITDAIPDRSESNPLLRSALCTLSFCFNPLVFSLYFTRPQWTFNISRVDNLPLKEASFFPFSLSRIFHFL